MGNDTQSQSRGIQVEPEVRKKIDLGSLVEEQATDIVTDKRNEVGRKIRELLVTQESLEKEVIKHTRALREAEARAERNDQRIEAISNGNWDALNDKWKPKKDKGNNQSRQSENSDN